MAADLQILARLPDDPQTSGREKSQLPLSPLHAGICALMLTLLFVFLYTLLDPLSQQIVQTCWRLVTRVVGPDLLL